jgi:general secretion pathway protein H
MTLLSSATGSRDAGYTLIELLIVLSVMGLLLLAVPTLVSAGMPGTQAKTAAQTLASDMRAARMDAIFTGVPRSVVIDADGKHYAVHPGLVLRAMPDSVSIVPQSTAARDAGTVLVFYPDGSSSGGVLRVGSDTHAHLVTDHALTGRIGVDE